MNIKIKELCEVDYIVITDPNTKPVPSIRTIVYDSDKNTLLEAFEDYQNNFDIDKVIDCNDEFDGGCLDVVKILSVAEVNKDEQ